MFMPIIEDFHDRMYTCKWFDVKSDCYFHYHIMCITISNCFVCLSYPDVPKRSSKKSNQQLQTTIQVLQARVQQLSRKLCYARRQISKYRQAAKAHKKQQLSSKEDLIKAASSFCCCFANILCIYSDVAIVVQLEYNYLSIYKSVIVEK